MPRLKKGTLRNSPTTARQREARFAKQAEALRLRQAGATYEQIGVQLKLGGKGNAHNLIQKALLATIQEPADDLRALELQRLDRLLLAVWQQALTPGMQQLATIDRVLKIMAQRCFYVTGLKVPDKIAPTTPDGSQPYGAEMGLAALLTQARAALAARAESSNGHALPASAVLDDPC